MAVQTAVITQRELQQIQDLHAEISEKQSLLDSLTESVKQLLFAKAAIESGRFDAKLSCRTMHNNPPWKQIVIDKLGYDYAEKVRRSMPTFTKCEVVVTEHAIPPLWRQSQAENEETQ